MWLSLHPWKWWDANTAYPCDATLLLFSEAGNCHGYDSTRVTQQPRGDQQVLQQFTFSGTSPGFCPIWLLFWSPTTLLQASGALPSSRSWALISFFIAFVAHRMDGEGTERRVQQYIWPDLCLLKAARGKDWTNTVLSWMAVWEKGCPAKKVHL